MDGMTVIGFSIFLQFLAAFLALRLIALTDRRLEWIVIAMTLFIIATSGCLALLLLLLGELQGRLLTISTGLTLGASTIILAGVLWMTSFIGSIKNSAEELRKSKEKYRLLIETMNDGLMVTDEKASITYANPKLCDMLGGSSRDLVGRSLYELLDPENQFVMKQFMTLREMGEQESFEIVWSRLDGRRITTMVSPTPIFDADSRFVGNIAVVKDMMKHKEAEEALRKSEFRLAEAQRIARLGNWEWDIETDRMRLSDEVYRIFGLSPQQVEFTYQSLMIRLPPEEQEFVKERINIALCGSAPYSIDHSILLPDNSRRYVHAQAEVIFDPAGKPAQMIGTVQDITERKEAEEALRASEEKFRSLFEDSMDAIYITDRDGRFLDVNRSAQRLFGYTKQEMIWKNRLELYVHPDCIDEYKGRMAGEECIENFETKFMKKDGSTVQTLLTSTVWRGHDGAVLGRQGIIRDMTELRLLEEKLLQSQKMEAVGRLAGGIAHDFNNLLMAIMGYDELMMCNLEPTDSLYNYAMEIHKATERAADLTRQLLAFSRRQVLKPKVLDLKMLVDNLEKMLHRLIGEDVHLTTILSPDLGKIKADPGQIEQVIMNLAINARDAMPNGGKLTIEAKDVDLERMHPNRVNPIEMGPYVMLSVSDTGVGMDKKVMPHIFEPFFTTKEQGKGTGLGLSTVYGIIKQSGGYIRVYSEPGNGTTFTIYLPRVEDGVSAAEPSRLDIVPRRGVETILLVEDEDMVRNLISESLRASGYTVLETSRGVEALSICRSHEKPIHLLMTDVIMPGMNGLELAQKVVSLRPEAKVIYMSGYAENSVLCNGILGPGAAFISKPFTPSALSEKVREVLGAC